MNGKIHDSVGFTKVDGAIRQLTLRERLQQIVNLGQPQSIGNIEYTSEDARQALDVFGDALLDTIAGNH